MGIQGVNKWDVDELKVWRSGLATLSGSRLSRRPQGSTNLLLRLKLAWLVLCCKCDVVFWDVK